MHCDGNAVNPSQCRNVSQFVAIDRAPLKLLTLRVYNPYKQEVAGSSPALPTRFPPSAMSLGCSLWCRRKIPRLTTSSPRNYINVQ